jgi:hypothetical protein
VRRRLWLVLALALAAGCASTRTYESRAPENVLVRSSIDSSIESVRGVLHIHEVDAQCRTQYLGSVRLDSPSRTLGLPAERPSYLVFTFEGSSFLGGSTSTSVGTLLKPRAGYRYEFGATYRQSIYQVSLQEIDARRGSSRELARRDLSRCAD